MIGICESGYKTVIVSLGGRTHWKFIPFWLGEQGFVPRTSSQGWEPVTCHFSLTCSKTLFKLIIAVFSSETLCFLLLVWLQSSEAESNCCFRGLSQELLVSISCRVLNVQESVLTYELWEDCIDHWSSFPFHSYCKPQNKQCRCNSLTNVPVLIFKYFLKKQKFISLQHLHSRKFYPQGLSVQWSEVAFIFLLLVSTELLSWYVFFLCFMIYALEGFV